MKELPPYCAECIHKLTECRNAGYGMPVQIRETCLLKEKQEPCSRTIIKNETEVEPTKKS